MDINTSLISGIQILSSASLTRNGGGRKVEVERNCPQIRVLNKNYLQYEVFSVLACSPKCTEWLDEPSPYLIECARVNRRINSFQEHR
jgi:hypothetical protein